MEDLIFKILSLGFVTALITFCFKYIFSFNFRHDYKKKKFNLIKDGLFNLKKLFDDNYTNPILPPYLLRVSVNESLATNKYSYKVIFFLMSKNVEDLAFTAKAIDKAHPYLRVKDMGNDKVILTTKYSLKKIQLLNNATLWVYVIMSILLLVAQLFENFIIKWMTLDLILIIVPVYIFFMFVTAFFGIKFNTIISLKNIVEFDNRA